LPFLGPIFKAGKAEDVAIVKPFISGSFCAPEAHFEIKKENTKKNLYRLPGIVYNTCANMRAKQLVLKSTKIGILIQR
jgi:hypothetical protein